MPKSLRLGVGETYKLKPKRDIREADKARYKKDVAQTDEFWFEAERNQDGVISIPGEDEAKTVGKTATITVKVS